MPTFLTTPFRRRSWCELAYALVSFPVGVAGFVFAVATLSLSAGLLITLLGFPLLVAGLVAARGWGSAHRGLARSLLGLDVVAPARVVRRRGLLSFLGDRAGWRAMLFLLVRFPLAILDFVVAISFWTYGLAAITYPLWFGFLPRQRGSDGLLHRGENFGPHFFIDTPARIAVQALAGLLLLLVAPWAIRGCVSLDRLLIRGLLGPTSVSQRVRELEATRALAVDDAAASLRRIERDLHDGAQARLVALAMSLGLAKEELGGDDPAGAVERVRSLVEAAHREAKGTIVDLRDLARGIHPPALDRGLDEALTTLASRSVVPVALHLTLPDRPSPAVESIVYFCTAELLTNVAKHSGAHHAAVSVVRGERQLVLRVEDDGAGGAVLHGGGGSGLVGLAERVSTVDGHLDIVSPEGGPTTMTIEIPL